MMAHDLFDSFDPCHFGKMPNRESVPQALHRSPEDVNPGQVPGQEFLDSPVPQGGSTLV
jgi:hypothetical protein